MTYPTAFLFRWGDTFCDDSVTASDAAFIMARIVDPERVQDCGPNIYGLDVFRTVLIDGEPHLWGDVNCSGGVDVVDALAILRFVAVQLQEAGCLPIGGEVVIDYWEARAPELKSHHGGRFKPARTRCVSGTPRAAG